MPSSLTALALAAFSLAAQSDTTLPVRPGTRLEVKNFGGQIGVRAWPKNAVRVEASHTRNERVFVVGADSVVIITMKPRRMMPRAVEYQIRVPDWMPLVLSGVHSDISVEGTLAEITAGTIKGNVTVRGGRGHITLNSVEGGVSLESARGRMVLSSVNEGVRVVRCDGEISAETLNGDIVFDRVDSKSIEATTVNGEISYAGPLRRGGGYHFATHRGDILLAIPRQSNAAVSIATFSGEFESAFPVTLTRTRRGRRLHFMIGSGGATLDLRTFQGSIQLRHLGAARPKE